LFNTEYNRDLRKEKEGMMRSIIFTKKCHRNPWQQLDLSFEIEMNECL
jgi:hypothetical protein